MIRKTNALVIVVTLVFLFACSQSREAQHDAPVKPGGKAEPTHVSIDTTGKKDGRSTTAEDRVQRIAREGEIVFEASDVKGTRAFLDKAVRDVNGYTVEETQASDNGRIENRLLIKVPADRFDALVAAIIANVAHVERKTIMARDVTEEYIDLDARIRSQMNLEKKFQDLLGKARTLDEVFKINQQIAEVREEIEAAQGKMKYLNDSVTYSRLAVTYYQAGSVSIRFFGRIWKGIDNGWTYFALFIIGIVNIWPFILVPALIVTGILVVRRRRRKRSPA